MARASGFSRVAAHQYGCEQYRGHDERALIHTCRSAIELKRIKNKAVESDTRNLLTNHYWYGVVMLASPIIVF